MHSSQIRLQKLGDQLGSISTTTGGDEEDSSMNIVSDSEGHCTISPQNDALNKSPSSKKNLGVQWGTADESTRGENIFLCFYIELLLDFLLEASKSNI